MTHQVLNLSLTSLSDSTAEGHPDTVLQRSHVVLRACTTGVVHAISMWFELCLVAGRNTGDIVLDLFLHLFNILSML